MADKDKFVAPQAPPTRALTKEETGPTPGPISRGLSTALMQGAFEKFGQAFTKTGDVRRDQITQQTTMQPWREAGQKAAKALEMRWHTMEYENFQAANVEPYMEAKKAMLQEYQQRHEALDAGVWIGPDGVPQSVDTKGVNGREQMIRLRAQLEKNFYSRNSDMDIELYNSATKYAQNPLVNERIQMVAKATSDQLMQMSNATATLASENVMSEISYRERTAAANEMSARAQSQQAAKAKTPKTFAEALADPSIGAKGLPGWLQGSPEGIDLMTTSGEYTKAKMAMQAQLLKDRPELKEDRDALLAHLDSLEGRIRNVAAAAYIKRMDPKAYEDAKRYSPHFFDFEDKGTSKSVGILDEKDERGYKGDRRLSQERKKELFSDWTKAWDNELDRWASDPSNPADPDAAMNHMTQWIKNAVVNGAEGVPANITIAANSDTKDTRAELISALIERGSSTVVRNKHIARENPMASLFDTISHPFGGTSSSGRAGRARRARQRRRKKGLLDEG